MTLIELMVVVAIMAVLAGIGIPLLVARLDGDAGRTATPPATSAREPADDGATGPTGPALSIRAVTVNVALSPRHRLRGLDVLTQYTARVDARYQLANDSTTGDVRVMLPFPDDTRDVWDVRATLRSAAGAVIPAGTLHYTRRGVTWVGEVPPGAGVAAELSYTAAGSDRLVMSVPAAGAPAAVDVAVAMPGLSAELVPGDGLQPTTVRDGALRWQFDNLVTERAIRVELPAAVTPVGRLHALSRLIGIAVLLFGAGFWYLSELRAPGALDEFRWAHFGLLACNYCLLFVVFAVLGFRAASPWPPLAVSAAVALPLLVLHVSRLHDLRFAVTRALPLAAATIAVPIAGVYGARYRAEVFVGWAAVAIAFVTVTYRPWAAGRKRRRDARAAAALRDRRTARVDGPLSTLSDAVRDAHALAGELEDDVREHPELGPAMCAELTRAATGLAGHVARRVALVARRARLADDNAGATDAGAHEEAVEVLVRDVERARERAVAAVAHARGLRDAAHDRVAELAAATRASEVDSGDRPRHCSACGRPAGDGSHCPHCGAALAVRLPCSRCAAITYVPTPVLRRRWRAIAVHCMHCGAAHVA